MVELLASVALLQDEVVMVGHFGGGCFVGFANRAAPRESFRQYIIQKSRCLMEQAQPQNMPFATSSWQDRIQTRLQLTKHMTHSYQ